MSLQQALIFAGALIAFFALLRLFGGYAPGWLVRCRKCGKTRNASEAGLIRVGKTGAPGLTLDYCSDCRKICWHNVELVGVPVEKK